MENKIYGYTKDNQTYYKLCFNQIEQTVVHTVSGKSCFDFMWIESSVFSHIFMTIQTAFVTGFASGNNVHSALGAAMNAASPYISKNSFLTAYISAFIDFLADMGTEHEKASETFTAFMGNDFEPPKLCASHYYMNMCNAIVQGIETKKAEMKFYLKEIMKDKKTPLPKRFINQAEESDLFKFDFETFLDNDGMGENDYTFLSKLNSIDDVIRFDFASMLANNIAFKPCKCCGEYFIPGGRVDSEYCDRIMPGETRPCNEIGALKTFDIVHKNDDIHKAYITAYRRMDSRQRAKLITKDEFKQFGKSARAERKKCYNGEITLEQFQKWLDDLK